jgi:hypothetical protein
VWLIDLFASPDEADAILGDLHEEFSAVAGRQGSAVARHWYWRQCARTLAHLVIGPFCTAPWPTLAVLVAGLAVNIMLCRAALWFAVMLVVPPLPDVGWTNAAHFRSYVLVFTVATALAHMFTGCTVACLAQRRPMAAALSVVCGMGVLMAVTQPLVYLGLRLMMFGALVLAGAALAARLWKDYEVTPALGR